MGLADRLVFTVDCERAVWPCSPCLPSAGLFVSPPRGIQAQLSHRYASDTRNAPENCGVPRPMSICGAKNHCPFRGHLALTGSTLMCWRRCSRNAVRTVGRRKSRLDHRFSLGALQSELPPPWHVWCLNRSAPHNALISSHIFSSGGKVGSKWQSAPRASATQGTTRIKPPPVFHGVPGVGRKRRHLPFLILRLTFGTRRQLILPAGVFVRTLGTYCSPFALRFASASPNTINGRWLMQHCC